MKPPIVALLFDVGGTLRFSKPDRDLRLAALTQLKDLISWEGSLDELEAFLASGEENYRRDCRRTLIEASEADLWSQYMLPGHLQDWCVEHAIELNQLWRNRRRRCLFPEVVAVMNRLSKNGYTLGIISNTTSSVEVPALLEENALSASIHEVILSTSFGRRKPHPSLFVKAARSLGLNPQNCAYIGNDPTRDLVGARQAGFGPVYLRRSFSNRQEDIDLEDNPQRAIPGMQPDGWIESLEELLDIFPSCPPNPGFVADKPLYDLAFSTMWGVDQAMPFADTFTAGQKIGFSRFELNHKVSPSLLNAYDHDRFYIATVHEPCPAEAGYDELKSTDIAISSLDDGRRIQALDMVKRSIELAASLGSRSVVIHPGAIVCEKTRDYHLRDLYQAGQRFSPAYQDLLEETITDRQKHIQPHLEMVIQSLQELISFTRGSGVSLGIENRYRYYDIPLPDEMALLLNLCHEEWFGFQYDVGHAQALSLLGFVDHFEWLERFGKRMIGVHLHDVRGLTDHQVPGKGAVDFARIAPYIPIQAQRTLEIGPHATLAEVTRGLEVLTASGCIERI